MTRSRIGATCAIVLTLGCGSLGMTARPAEAATVFSNYSGATVIGFAGLLYASGFTPTADYDFTGAAAFVQNQDPLSNPQPFTMALYSATSTGVPDSVLWTSGTLSGPGPIGTSTLVTTTYSGPPILLQSGDEYFLAVDLPNGLLWWVSEGTSFTPFYEFFNNSWTIPPGGPFSQQFEVFGTAVVPELPTWAAMLLGFAGLSFAGYRGSRKGWSRIVQHATASITSR
jgi:hypothetical protein